MCSAKEERWEGREAIVFSPILDPTSLRPKVSHEVRLRAKKREEDGRERGYHNRIT